VVGEDGHALAFADPDDAVSAGCGEHNNLHAAEHRTARALQTMLERSFEQLRKAFLYDDGSREILEVNDRHWTELCLAAFPWRQHPDFDTARWRSAEHRNAEHEVEMAAYRRSLLR
jgi:hypothetical protein